MSYSGVTVIVLGEVIVKVTTHRTSIGGASLESVVTTPKFRGTLQSPKGTHRVAPFRQR